MIPVTAAILIKDGRILAARRKKDMHLSGYWEFPGGKIEDGESPQECLRRELKEEFGVHCVIGSFFEESVHDYGTKVIRLLSFFVTHISGDFQLRDHDRLLWLVPGELSTIEWAPADVPFVEKLQSPFFELPKNACPR